MNSINRLIIIYILGTIFSCDYDEKELITFGTKIDSTKMIHWGKGFYKTKIHYSFSYNNEYYECYYTSSKLTRIYDYIYSKGDSILITFPPTDPNKSRVLKRIFY